MRLLAGTPRTPTPRFSPGKQPVQAFIDVWVENPQLIGSMTLMVQTPPGSGPYACVTWIRLAITSLFPAARDDLR